MELKDYIELFLVFLIVLEILISPIYSILIIYKIVRRYKTAHTSDYNMRKIAVLFALSGLIGCEIIGSFRGTMPGYLILQVVFILSILGGFYYALSFKVYDEKAKIITRKLDTKLRSIYTKYLEPHLAKVVKF
jgi:hypothetical protein